MLAACGAEQVGRIKRIVKIDRLTAVRAGDFIEGVFLFFVIPLVFIFVALIDVGFNIAEVFVKLLAVSTQFSALVLKVNNAFQFCDIRIHFDCKADERGTLSAMAAVLDNDLFWQAYENLNASTLQLTTFTSTFVEGTIICNRDGLLYTSIPQNGNWKAYVDGVEAEITLIGDCMIGIQLSEGVHTVSFRYENQSFALGWKISLGCAVLFAAIAVVVYRSRAKKGRYEK